MDGKIIHIHDVLSEPDYKMTTAKIGGIRTMLGVPLLREGTPIGVIALQRKDVRPFTQKQIELDRRSPTKPRSQLRMCDYSRPNSAHPRTCEVA